MTDDPAVPVATFVDQVAGGVARFFHEPARLTAAEIGMARYGWRRNMPARRIADQIVDNRLGAVRRTAGGAVTRG